MILWFAGGVCLIVWLVFRDPRIDYRVVALGALLPDVALRLTPMHSLVFPVVLLAAVMLGTRRGSARRRLLLPVPIGAFLHLVLDGMWSRSAVFWWPFLGSVEWGRLPSLDRPVGVLVLQEVLGLGALWWVLGQRAAVVEKPPTC